MTVKQLCGSLGLRYTQEIHITDEAKKRTYISDPGLPCFEDCADMFGGDYEECIRYINRMKVQYFTASDNLIWIRAEPGKERGGKANAD